MAVLKIILTVVFIIISIALTVIILMQEGKSAGLGAIAGAADTYWGKNKGRSMEGRLVTGTKILVVLFIVIAAVLNLGIFEETQKTVVNTTVFFLPFYYQNIKNDRIL